MHKVILKKITKKEEKKELQRKFKPESPLPDSKMKSLNA